MTTLTKRLFTGQLDVSQKDDEKWTLGKEICREQNVERFREELEWNGCTSVVLCDCDLSVIQMCIAHSRNYLWCAQTWITQFYLQITPCLPLLPSRRASPPFGWYSFYRPTEGRRLSRLVVQINPQQRNLQQRRSVSPLSRWKPSKETFKHFTVMGRFYTITSLCAISTYL